MVGGDLVEGGIVLGGAFAVDAVEVVIEGSALVDLGSFDVGGVDVKLFKVSGEIEQELSGRAV